MRFREIRIDRYGVWRDLTLAPLSPGVNVVHGPNEAGKTTLLGFIRGVLYGFPRPGEAWGASRADGLTDSAFDAERSGSLIVEAQGDEFEIARIDAGSGAGLLGVRSLRGGDEERTDAERLHNLLHGTDRALFEGVFAIGLHELQELATLEDDEVARYIHDTLLGPDGRRLLDAGRIIDEERRRLFDPGTGSGRIAGLLRRHGELSAQIAAFASRRDEHATLVGERARLEERIEAARRERNELHRQLRGHLYLDRVHPPWKQVRDLKSELAGLPQLAGFPENGLAQLGELEAEIDSATRCRKTLMSEMAELRAEAAELLPEKGLGRHAGELAALVASRDWIVQLEANVANTEAAIEDAESELRDALAEISPEWNPRRIEQEFANGSNNPLATLLPELLAAARRYQAALVRRGRLRKRRRQLTAAVQRRTVEIEQRLAAMGIEELDALDSAIERSRQRLAELENLGRLELRLAELERRRDGMELERGRLESQRELPRWMSAVFTFLAVSGVVFLVLGIATGVTTSGIAGLAYALLGLTCGGMAWAHRTHYQREAGERLDELFHALCENGERRRETRETIARIDPTRAASEGAAPEISVDALLADETRRFAALERIAAAVAVTKRARDRLTELRSRHRAAIRAASDARQAWCSLLRRAGLPETVSIEDGFKAVSRLAAARDSAVAIRALRESLQRDRPALEAVRGRMERLGRSIGRWNASAPPGEILDGWAEALAEARNALKSRRDLLREIKVRRKEARHYARRIADARTRRAALLVRGGAATREEFEERAELVARRKELQELLALAEEDLAIAVRTEPDLAIVEEDLAAFDMEGNSQRIADLNGRIARLEEELEALHEALGGVKHRLRELVADRSVARLRLEREQAATALRRAAEEWLGTLAAARTAERMRRDYERAHQPPTLRAASRYLAAFTEGKFASVWAPLGERSLLVEDHAGRSRTIAELSGGTREQLLLAVRLAVADRLAERGAALPLVLDDVFVNFDRQRTEAAVRTLLEFAGDRRQVLIFTCHEHLAESFRRHGVETLRLPEHAERMEWRRAG